MKTKNKDIILQNKIFGWMALATGLILMIPFIGTQVSNEWKWGPLDFIIIGILLFGAGSIFILVARNTPRKYRTLIGVAFVLAVLLIWVHLAVGVVDTWPLAGS